MSLALALLAAPHHVHAQDQANVAPGFEVEVRAESWSACVTRLRATAIEQGIEPSVANHVLADVKQLPRVISSDRSQPEFTTTFADYYGKRVTDGRTEKGRRLLQQNLHLLSEIQQSTGIPPQYLMSFWGLETNFGGYVGKLSLPSALTTLACDTRRAKFFTDQLFAAMRIVASGDMRKEELIGSWAGAVGHMQFMPTTFLSYAVDGDGDGRRDLLGSVEDALFSGGNFLAELGWQAGYRWGREVLLPEGFEFADTGLDQWRPLSDWAAKGITDVFGRPLPALDMASAVLVPAGHEGPAFVVYPNFKVIMQWNRSEYYALSVARLADRISGSGRLAKTLPDQRIATADVISLQENLASLGFELGEADGILGPATRKAVRNFQQQHGLIADGYPHQTVMQKAASAQKDAGLNTQVDNDD